MGTNALKILAVDDTADNLVALRAVLAEAMPGCELATAGDGGRGLGLARTWDPDVILLDIVMPGMDGFAVCRQLKADERTREIPVVFLTALHTDRRARIEALEVGAEGFLSKPPDEQELIAQIRAMAKLKAASRQKRLEKDELEARVQQRTRELARELEEHRRTEKALVESEGRLRLLVDASPDGILVVTGGRFAYVNDAAVRMFGASAQDDFLGRPALERLHPDSRPILEEGIRLVLADQATVPAMEGTCLRLDGTVFEAEASAVPIAYEGEDGALVFLRDVTARKLAEAERERLAKAIEQAAEAIVVTDPRGNIVYVNPAFEAVSGYRRAEAIGQNPRILKSGTQDEAFYRELWEAISAGRTWKGRLVNRRKDGQLYTEEATISPVRDGSGAITSYVAVKRDISRDLMLEAQLLQSQKMESIGRLAGGVAHDFNNILAVILSSASFALEAVPEEGELRSDLLEIQGAGERAAALTRQLLAFSRKQVLKSEPLALNRLITGIEKMLKRMIGEDVELVLELAPDLGIVRADPGQIEQVIMNLAVNARDAMPKGGTLTLRTTNVPLGPGQREPGVSSGPHVLLEIVDTGVGMDEATRAQLFEPFFTTKERGKGTGLGLSTVYGIVRQSGGTIRVESEPGAGTDVLVFLPACSQEVRAAPEIPAAVQLDGTETILVVEDDEPVRILTRRMLASAGYRVFTAENGRAALLFCKQHQGDIQLVLTDVVMPQMGGKDFGERLAEVRPGARLLFMSGYTDDAIGRQGELEPGTNFIPKPFTQNELLRKVREVLDASVEVS